MKNIKRSTNLLAGVALIALFSVQTLYAENRPVIESFINTNHIVNKLKTDSVKNKIEYSAQDSMILSKDNSVITLYGQVKFNCASFNITADEIAFDKVNNKITAKNFTFFNKHNQLTTSGVSGKFDVNSKN